MELFENALRMERGRMVGMLEGGRMERLVKRIPKVGKYFLEVSPPPMVWW